MRAIRIYLSLMMMITTMTHGMMPPKQAELKKRLLLNINQLRQRHRLLHDYIKDLYRYLKVDPGNIDLVNPDLFKVEKSKSGAVELRFFDSEIWISLTNKRTGKFLAKSTLQNKFGSVERMKKILSIEGDDLDRSFAKKLQDQLPTDLEMENIPLQDLSTLPEQVHVATREAATNTGLAMWEFLGIDKALRCVQIEIINNTAKLSELDKQLARDREKLEEIKDNPSYSEELKKRIWKRIENAETEREARLEVLLMNKKEVQSQVLRINPILHKGEGVKLPPRPGNFSCITFFSQKLTTWLNFSPNEI